MIHLPKRGLPRTGQTITAPTANYRAGDDGTYQAGVRAAGTRAAEFVDNGNGTVTDYGTGLVWVKQPELIIPGAVGVTAANQILRARATWKVPPDDGLGAYVAGDLVKGDGSPDALYYICILGHTAHADKEPPNATYWRNTLWTASAANLTTPATMTWNTAIDNCEALEYAGFTDWRLPNIYELFSLFDFGDAASPLINALFTNTQWSSAPNYYCTSTTRTGSTTNANSLYFGDTSTPVYAVAKATAYFVRPVRGGFVLTAT